MGKYKTLGKNSLFIMLGTFGSKFISFLMLPLYTRWLSVGDFGLTDLLTIYSTLLVSIFSLSLSESIFVFPANHNKTVQSRYFTSGLCAILFIAVVVLILSIISRIFFIQYNISNTFTDNLLLIYCMFFATSFQSYLQMFCKGINKMRTFCFAGIIFTGLTAIFSFLFIPKYGVKGFVCSNVLANICSSIFVIFCEKLHTYFSLKYNEKSSLREMLAYSIPMIPNTIMWWILSAINRPIINSQLGLEAIGLFAVANKISSILTSVTQIFNSSWQVSVLQEYGKEGFATFFNKVGNSYLSILILLSSLVAIFSQIIMRIAVDEKFFDAWKYLPIISVAVIFNGLASHAGTLFSATKKSKYFLLSSATGAICSIIFNILLIPYCGLYGAAISFTLSQIAIGLYRAFYANKIVKFSNITPMVFLLLINICIILLILNEQFFISVILFIVGCITYIVSNKQVLKDIFTKFLRPKNAN